MVSSFSWSSSNISVKAIQLPSGNFVLFVLKMPNFFSSSSITDTLETTLNAIQLFDSNLFTYSNDDNELICYIRKSLSSRSFIYTNYTFNVGKENQNFQYTVRPVSIFNYSAHSLPIIAQLFELIEKISDRILYVAFFESDKLVTSTFPKWFSYFLPLFSAPKTELGFSCMKSLFKIFSLYLPINDNVTPVTLAVSEIYENLKLFVMFKDQRDFEDIINQLTELVSSGIEEFYTELVNWTDPKETTNGVVGIWSENGIASIGGCKPNTLSQISNMYSGFKENDGVVVCVNLDAETSVAGAKFLGFQMFSELPSKGNWADLLQKHYEAMKSAFPNLPEEFKNI
ncbi:hypothetical protein GPJ56_010831 [Histomonas meleagridis]|uniref:uncharacterized protein n=1 Tax=Histomonas meleagridis TaxID=135588 RepID=UPI00355A6D38|nr:hypothetical protein GPJ56_010831 [Histomonas meleagridis]KAH0803747.1 hypothetical protein GO595_003521 [Histomonas meleagridis]